jgi:hypothetical protein
LIVSDKDVHRELFLEVPWQSDGCRHSENFRCDPVNLWRDLLIPELLEQLRGAFTNFSSVSYRNWKRPETDPHPLPYSDRLFIIRAEKSSKFQG